MPYLSDPWLDSRRMVRDQEGLQEVEAEAHYVKLAEDSAQQLREQV